MKAKYSLLKWEPRMSEKSKKNKSFFDYLLQYLAWLLFVAKSRYCLSIQVQIKHDRQSKFCQMDIGQGLLIRVDRFEFKVIISMLRWVNIEFDNFWPNLDLKNDTLATVVDTTS